MMNKTHLALAVVSSIALSGTAFAADMASPPNSLVVADTGNVGVGTAIPESNLHVVGGESGSLLQLESGKPKFTFKNATSGVIWGFGMTNDDGFKVNLEGSGVTEYKFDTNGDLKILGALTQGSDRNNKQDIVAVDSMNVLETVAQLPISTWEYKGQDGVKHLGPMAQDFHAAFGLGHTPKGISSIDTGGVALAAIKGLNQVVQSKEQEVQSLKAENAEFAARLTMLENLVNKLAAKEVVMNQ